jgi:peptidoglycan/LPS O-acetylase OafA/YrhL
LEIPKAAGLSYAGLNRLAWGISISWVIFACVKGYGWLVNDFLSWKVFMPLGRLCYCVYLVSLHLQMILHVGMKQPMGYSTYTLVLSLPFHISL